ncbi:MAG: hypothetical protein ACQEP1_03510 [Nanobdellota archaeon]
MASTAYIYIFLFIITLSIIFGQVITHTEVMKSKSISVREAAETRFRKLHTDSELENIHPDSSGTDFIFRNTGSVKLKKEDINIFLDGSPVETEKNIITNFINPEHWDMEEKINVSTSETFNGDTNNTITITASYGHSKTYTFNTTVINPKLVKAEKSSVPVTEVTSKVEESDNNSASLSIPSGTTQHINYTFDVPEGTIHSSETTLEHNMTTSLERKELQYYEDGWTTINELSYFSEDNTEKFDKASEYMRTVYNSSSDEKAYVDMIRIKMNISSWSKLS